MGKNWEDANFFNPTINLNVAGIIGDKRPYQEKGMDKIVKCNGKVFFDNLDFYNYGLIYDMEGRPKGEFELELYIYNNERDGIKGVTNVISKWTDYGDEADYIPPTLTYLQFKTPDGDVTDEFDKPEGNLNFSAGDYEPGVIFNVDGNGNNYNYFTYQPVTAQMAYRPHGDDDFTEITVNEIPENLIEAGFGAFFTADLSQVTKTSETGWYDLQITITDERGNSQVQTISPAFKIKSLSGVNSIIDEKNPVKVIGNNILAPDGAVVYAADGIKVGKTNLRKGIYFVYVNGNWTKVMIP